MRAAIAAGSGVLFAQPGSFDSHAGHAREPLRLQQIGIAEALRFGQAVDADSARLGMVAARADYGRGFAIATNADDGAANGIEERRLNACLTVRTAADTFGVGAGDDQRMALALLPALAIFDSDLLRERINGHATRLTLFCIYGAVHVFAGRPVVGRTAAALAVLNCQRAQQVEARDHAELILHRHSDAVGLAGQEEGLIVGRHERRRQESGRRRLA